MAYKSKLGVFWNR